MSEIDPNPDPVICLNSLQRSEGTLHKCNGNNRYRKSSYYWEYKFVYVNATRGSAQIARHENDKR